MMTSWRHFQERGSVWGMVFTATLYRLFGRILVEPLLWAIVGYFFLTDARVRKSSLEYLARVHDDPNRKNDLEAYWHCLSFARTSLDRFDVWGNQLDRYTFHFSGDEHLSRLQKEGRGAILIGAHLGNFDMLRAIAKSHRAKVHVLADPRNSRKFHSILKRFCPGIEEGIVEYNTESMDSIFQLQGALERGDFVALLADRMAAEGGRAASRVSSAVFLKDKALFPQAPFLFAAHMKCPVLLIFALRRSAREYDFFIEPFADSIDVSGPSREAALNQYIAAYAARLECYCKRYPLQWFNFYDFWKEPA